LRYAEFVAPLVKAVQEQQKLIQELQQLNTQKQEEFVVPLVKTVQEQQKLIQELQQLNTKKQGKLDAMKTEFINLNKRLACMENLFSTTSNADGHKK
jgi:hypothetical protein